MWTINENPRIARSTTVISALASQRIALSGGSAVRFSVGAQGIWYKFGGSAVDATAGTAAEGYVPANTTLDVPVPITSTVSSPNTITHVAIIQAAATAVGSVEVYE
jgi:hypothetical protein